MSAGGEQSAQRCVVAGDEDAPFGVPTSAIKHTARPERRHWAKCQRGCHIGRLHAHIFAGPSAVSRPRSSAPSANR